MKGDTVSVIIITKNEEENIRECLESVCWADEIIVVDSGSDDETVNICKEFTDKVYIHDWPGFGPQKNRALDYAVGDWVLSVDADERISEKLRAEIIGGIRAECFDAYEIPRMSSYCGKFIKHGGWWPDYVLRLFKKEKGRFTDNIVHEKVVVSGRIGKMKEHIVHYTYRNLEKVLDTINLYSTEGAKQKKMKGAKGGVLTAILHGSWMFFRTYVLKAGFLDGPQGFMLAVSNAEGSYYKYLKMKYPNKEV